MAENLETEIEGTGSCGKGSEDNNVSQEPPVQLAPRRYDDNITPQDIEDGYLPPCIMELPDPAEPLVSFNAYSHFDGSYLV